jgi:hypothetical protein
MGINVNTTKRLPGWVNAQAGITLWTLQITAPTNHNLPVMKQNTI